MVRRVAGAGNAGRSPNFSWSLRAIGFAALLCLSFAAGEPRIVFALQAAPITPQLQADQQNAQQPLPAPTQAAAPQAPAPEEAILYENGAIRVRRTTYPPGKDLPLESHKARVVVFLSDGTERVGTTDGRSHDVRFHRGMVFWRDAGEQSLDNVGGTTLDAIEVELLRPYPAAAQPYPGDALRQDPAHFKMVFANDQVRVLAFFLGPREATAVHDHLDRVVVQLLPIHARVTLADGSQSELDAAQDDARFESSVRHTVENLSPEPTAAISIEFEPPQPNPPVSGKPAKSPARHRP